MAKNSSFSFPKCTLVTPTYNWPEALELLLLSIKNQSILPNEVIIADDGSKKETRSLIIKYQDNFPVPLYHIWHEDKKNRKTTIMNKAIARSKYDYIIEIDGDIIMHKHFVRDHLSLAEKNVYLFGSRVNIQQDYLDTLFNKKKIYFNIFSKGIKKRLRTLHIPILANLYRAEDKMSSKLRGCNMSFWKSDFLKVNGFNESLVGWGIDDSEMIQRLINIGVRGKRLKFKGIVYHIYHKEQNKSQIGINKLIEEETINKKITYVEKGVDQYL